jgi:hypothetical protein
MENDTWIQRKIEHEVTNGLGFNAYNIPTNTPKELEYHLHKMELRNLSSSMLSSLTMQRIDSFRIPMPSSDDELAESFFDKSKLRVYQGLSILRGIGFNFSDEEYKPTPK